MVMVMADQSSGLLNAGRSLYLVSVVLLNRASDSRFLRIVVSACLQGAPAVAAHDDFHHGSRFRSGADLYSLTHAIHCHLHHRPRPGFCRHFFRHRQSHRQPFATSITAAAVAAAFDAFVAIDDFVAIVAAVRKCTASSATVSHRQPLNALQRAIIAPCSERSLRPAASDQCALQRAINAPAGAAAPAALRAVGRHVSVPRR